MNTVLSSLNPLTVTLINFHLDILLLVLLLYCPAQSIFYFQQFLLHAHLCLGKEAWLFSQILFSCGPLLICTCSYGEILAQVLLPFPNWCAKVSCGYVLKYMSFEDIRDSWKFLSLTLSLTSSCTVADHTQYTELSVCPLTLDSLFLDLWSSCC